MIIFGTGALVAVPTMDAAGNAIANPTPVKIATLQEVQWGFKFEEKKLYGSGQFPIALGRGKATMDFTAKMANFDPSVAGSLLFGTTPATGLRASVLDSLQAIPASTPYQITITPPNTGTFAQDLGVFNAATGIQLSRVATAPIAGQYSVSALGVYTFASADAGKNVLINYEYTSSSTGQIFTINNQMMGAAPFFTVGLQSSYQGQTLALKLNSCTSSDLSLPFKNEDFSVSDFKFSAAADKAGIVGYLSMF